VEQLPEKLGAARFFPKTDVKEVDTIGQAFNALISELDRKQQKVANQAVKFRLFFNEASDPVFITDLNGQILETNAEAQHRLGYTSAELAGMSIADLDTPDYATEVSARIARLIRDGQATFESEHRCKDGTIIPVEVHAKIINYNDKPANLAVARDIRDRKQVGRLLQCRNEYLLALHETTLGLIGRLDLNNLLTAIVNRAANLVGSQHGYLYLMTQDGSEMQMRVRTGIFETFRTLTIKPGEGLAGKVWQRGEPIKVDDYSHWPERVGDVQREAVRALIGVPLRSDKTVVGVIGLAFLDPAQSFSDDQMEMLNRFAALASLAFENARLYEEAQQELSERRKAEESLRIFSYAVEQSPVSIVITSTSGLIEYVNPHFTTITGYGFEDVVGGLPSILTKGFLKDEEYRQLWDLISSGFEWRGEFHNRKISGEYYWEQVLMAPIRDKDGRITNYIIVTEDINERKRLEGQLRQSQKMEAIGQLAAGIAHDFNNILTAIIGYATMVQMKLPEGSPGSSSVEQIVLSAERAASLTQGLLAFSRKQISSPRQADLNEIVMQVSRLLDRLIGEQIVLSTTLSQQALLVMADTGQMEQVLMNLVTNARDALPDGGAIEIKTDLVELDGEALRTVGVESAGRYALLEVHDNGSGMDQETLKHIFEPFFTTKEAGRGTGLGLAIASGIIQQHGGRILCSSNPVQGTTFQIYLPVSEGSLLPESDQPESAALERGSEVVLLAEDDETARTLSRKILEEFGYAVIEASDGEETLNKYRQYREVVNLVMMDLVMPKIRGRELVSGLKAINPDVRLLICSGHSDDVVNRECLQDELALLPKPFKPGQLLRKVREVLDR
jgi:PAS domain S-box-containing protein